MNKYSNKIIKFINKNNFKINNVDIINYKFIIDIKNICNEIFNINIFPMINLHKINYIKKLHSKNNFPQLYYFFKEYKPSIINTFPDFVSYYALNQHNINTTIIEREIIGNDKLIDLFNNIYHPNNERSELVNIFYNNFQSIDIIQEIESHDLTHIEIKLQNIRLSIYYYNIQHINQYITDILRITLLINKIAKKFNILINDYDLIIFLGNNKKYLFNKKKIITPMNINSGATLFTSYVSLWRKEEYEKVLIHELLHYIGIDYHLFQNNDLNNKIKNIFNIDGINNINESYNESVASIINMCWKSTKYNLNINDIYQYEIKFLIFQTNKIIKFFNGKNALDLFNIKISQTSSALSYIIIKTIIFLNIIDIINFIESVEIRLNTFDKINLYETFLLNNLLEKKYIKIFADNFNITTNTKNKFIDKTMRMSVL